MECEAARFIARIEGQEAWLFLPSATYKLTGTEAASGSKFQNDELVFWLKGDEGQLTGALGDPTGCHNNRALAQWEHAKLSGVDFRGIGQEPPWTLEIAGEQMRLWWGYERSSIEVTVNKVVQFSQRTLYHITASGEPWSVELYPGPCADSMSGEQFDTKIMLDTGKRKYLGCGSALH
ncbi:hypothetical protein GCM10023333_36000 [Ferrimonas pelagia]|uniref:C-type lysozyme inhibitor domain-containing protein n=2 Tax=Ferrimonas pelagia TaxID=1177826 RepID=A0ABP9FEG2_9GAMM